MISFSCFQNRPHGRVNGRGRLQPSAPNSVFSEIRRCEFPGAAAREDRGELGAPLNQSARSCHRHEAARLLCGGEQSGAFGDRNERSVASPNHLQPSPGDPSPSCCRRHPDGRSKLIDTKRNAFRTLPALWLRFLVGTRARALVGTRVLVRTRPVGLRCPSWRRIGSLAQCPRRSDRSRLPRANRNPIVGHLQPHVARGPAHSGLMRSPTLCGSVS